MLAATDLAQRALNRQQLVKQPRQVRQIQRVRSVGFGLGWVVVDFEEDAVYSGGYRGACEDGDELGLSAGDSVGG